MKMGWMLTGQGFPKKWRNSWKVACKTMSDLGMEYFPEDETLGLEVVRHLVNMVRNCTDEKTVEKVRKDALPEVFEQPTMPFDELLKAVKEAQ